MRVGCSETLAGSRLRAVSKAGPDGGMDRFQVFGERRSGTNVLERFIAANTGLKRVRDFGWKHGFPVYPVLPRRCLFVVVVRDPFDWLKSFYRAPFEAAPEIAALPFSEFLRAEWKSLYTPRKSGWKGHGYALDLGIGRGEELQADRHPITGRRFANVVELRRLKLAGHLSLLERGVNAAVLRYEDFLTDREAVLADLADAFGLTLAADYRPMERPVGPRPEDARTTPAETRPAPGFSDDDRAFVLQGLDQKAEAFLGYLSAEAREQLSPPGGMR